MVARCAKRSHGELTQPQRRRLPTTTSGRPSTTKAISATCEQSTASASSCQGAEAFMGRGSRNRQGALCRQDGRVADRRRPPDRRPAATRAAPTAVGHRNAHAAGSRRMNRTSAEAAGSRCRAGYNVRLNASKNSSDCSRSPARLLAHAARQRLVDRRQRAAGGLRQHLVQAGALQEVEVVVRVRRRSPQTITPWLPRKATSAAPIARAMRSPSASSSARPL